SATASAAAGVSSAAATIRGSLFRALTGAATVGARRAVRNGNTRKRPLAVPGTRSGMSVCRGAATSPCARRAPWVPPCSAPLAALAPGDLVFLRIRRRGIDHVGVYAGGGRFVHAPRAGQAVAYGDLSRGFYARHLVSAGRFWDRSTPPPVSPR